MKTSLNVLDNLCDICNSSHCSCHRPSFSLEIDDQCLSTNIPLSKSKLSENTALSVETETSEQHNQVHNNQNLSQNSRSETQHFPSTNNMNKDSISANLMKKGYNIAHLNVQGLCGDKLSKFSEISLMLTSKKK